MIVSEVIRVIESFAPPVLQESYDNSGLYCGDKNALVNKILLTLDITEQVVEEAIDLKCELIIAHHPTIFKPLNKITGANSVERILLKAIKNSIALYACHTNLDNVYGGVNFKLAEKMGLQKVKILQPNESNLQKLTVFVPVTHTQQLLKALGEAGAGQIGNYKNCSFRTEGVGTFMPTNDAQPHIGVLNKQEEVLENRIEVIVPSYIRNKVLEAMFSSHPYEEVAYFIQGLSNENQDTGAGAIGEFDSEMPIDQFLSHLKTALDLKVIKYTPIDKKIKKVAICGGAGSFLIKRAIGQGADAFVSSDFKYHDYFESEDKMIIADIGHYESEVFTKELFFELLTKKITNIAVLFSTVNTNPVKYYH